MTYCIIAVIAYIVGSHIYEVWLPCMIVATMNLLKFIYIHIFKYAQKHNKIHGKTLEEFSDKEIFDETIRRTTK